jgi:hypothetical protein
VWSEREAPLSAESLPSTATKKNQTNEKEKESPRLCRTESACCAARIRAFSRSVCAVVQASINLKPDFPSSYMYLGMTLARLDDFENACAAYDKVFVSAAGRSCHCYVQHLLFLYLHAPSPLALPTTRFLFLLRAAPAWGYF